ncbi:MAG: hypothetical protein AW09_000546 [Candidatus Accumulibacter phosphatis]|uniref:Uncharacterized protein n=1 Tax=Candidatus Accumulibacter phosphatis TaxID=327160 RepID=A0A080LZD4_9PROT|nr:hypothetical protein [Accumulibacter sp.]KFB74166.1 MAG: hypothetical protein AW09_000546 [Candidatus Accumulibacter phosphatis]HRF12165.1 hypothetical protein [Candidatus Accumulibacter phosphatis]
MIHANSNHSRTAAGERQARVKRRPRTRFAVTLAALASAFTLGGIHHNAHAVLVTLDTTSLNGTSARLDFALLDGDSLVAGDPGDGNNTVTISSIVTNGTLGGVDCSVGCTGGPPFTISDLGGLGQFLQDLTLGTTVSFDLSFTSHFSGNGAPDRLSLLLLDPGTNLTLVDTSLDFSSDPVPVQDALLIVDHAPGAQIQFATVSSPLLPIAVPEPGAGMLFSLALALIGGQRIRRAHPCVSHRTEAAAQTRLSTSTSTHTHPGE